jgi:hypothetical protein
LRSLRNRAGASSLATEAGIIQHKMASPLKSGITFVTGAEIFRNVHFEKETNK